MSPGEESRRVERGTVNRQPVKSSVKIDSEHLLDKSGNYNRLTVDGERWRWIIYLITSTVRLPM